MDTVRLGKTEIVTNKNGFGALPIQRVSESEAVKIVRTAYERGITFFDTARWYTDSEQKLGAALSDVRRNVYRSSKTGSTEPEGFWKDLETTLTNLKTDYLDIYQFHNPAFCPKPGDGSGLYECMEEAKKQGKIRHIGITNHRLAVAEEAIDSGLYDTLQFPFCYLATDADIRLGRAENERTGRIFVVYRASAGDDRRTPRPDRKGPRGADGRILPRLRVLHALSGGDRD